MVVRGREEGGFTGESRGWVLRRGEGRKGEAERGGWAWDGREGSDRWEREEAKDRGETDSESFRSFRFRNVFDQNDLFLTHEILAGALDAGEQHSSPREQRVFTHHTTERRRFSSCIDPSGQGAHLTSERSLAVSAA